MLGCKPLTDTEIQSMEAALSNPRDLLLFKLGLRTGFRISELLSIKITDVLEHDGSIKDLLLVSRSKMKGKKKGRAVPLSSETKTLLKTYINSLDASQTWLFESNRGNPLERTLAWRIIKAAALKAGIKGKVATHSMRKSFSKKVYETTGKDLVLTQKIIGHVSIQSTISYLQVDRDTIDDIWKKL